MVTGMTRVSIGLRGMGVDVDYEFGNCWARGMEFGSRRGACKEVGGMKKNKIGGIERMPKPEQTSGPWLGWPGLCRGVSFKGVGVGVRMHASTNYFVLPPFLRPSHPQRWVELEKPIYFSPCVLWKVQKEKQARVTIPGRRRFT
jgi:hypothetical protein